MTSVKDTAGGRTGNIGDGTVEVTNGKIVVKNPEGTGKEARVSSGAGVKLFVDNIEIKGARQVMEKSKVEAVAEDKAPERKFEVIVDTDNMAASVVVQYRDGEKYILKDKFPANELVVDKVFSESIKCEHFTLEEAKKILKEKQIVYGIMEENLLSAIDGGCPAPTVIAAGKAPEDGTDDRMELKFDDHKKLVEVNDRIDFYSIGKVVSVEADALVAVKIPGDEGRSGIDIFSNVVPQQKGKRIQLKAGRGTRVSEDGLCVYSSIYGKPEEKNGIISVHEVYEVSGDVNVATGNIEFIGDVVIRGNITDGMKVKAGNNVVLYGSVTGGEITAGGHVTVYKNIISSKVRAGCNDYMKFSIIELLEGAKDTLIAIFYAASALKETGKVPKTYKDGQLIKFLIDTKYNSLNSVIANIRNTLADNKEWLDMDTLRLGAILVKFFSGNGPLLLENCATLQRYGEYIDKHIYILRSELKDPSHITASYAQNSDLSTSGNIRIEGRGCYTSELNCRGDIVIDKAGSVTRGGTISAGGEVRLYELGSLGGAPTVVSAGGDFSIICEVAHDNSVIRVGNMSNTLEESFKKLKAYLYKGELMIEKSKI